MHRRSRTHNALTVPQEFLLETEIRGKQKREEFERRVE